MENLNDINYAIIPKVIDFDLKKIVQRYSLQSGCNIETVKRYEVELKKFLALCILFPEKQYEMLSKEVDALWHAFICDTPNYIAFCNKLAGRYIHHVPEDSEIDVNGYTQQTIDQLDAAGAFDFHNDYFTVYGIYPPTDVWPKLESVDVENYGDCRSPASCKTIYDSTYKVFEF